MLPPSMVLRVRPGRHSPCLHGCVLTVGMAGLVGIAGPSRERVFEQAGRFLRGHARGLPPLSIPATLATPAVPGGPGRDGWTIAVGAGVSFSPTSLPPVLFGAESTVLGAG